jgi:ketosteroid isomerase-like protein
MSLAFLAIACTAAAHAQSGSTTEKEVLQAMYAMDQAEAKRDKAALERLHADEYLFHGSNGQAYTKAQSIADTMAGTTTWTDRRNDGLKVRVYGDVAIVTGTVTLSGTSTTYRTGARTFTRLFIRRDGGWQELGGQATLVPTK